MKHLVLIAIAALFGCGEDLSKPVVSPTEITEEQCSYCLVYDDVRAEVVYDPAPAVLCGERQDEWCPRWCEAQQCARYADTVADE